MTTAETKKVESPTSSRRRTTRIVVVDDHELMRNAISQLISHEADLKICGEAAGEDDALRKLRTTKADLMVVDISLEQGNGIELIKRAKVCCPATRIIVLSMYDESLYAERALRAGAMGYVNKQAPARSIITAIREVLHGKLYLSESMTQRIMHGALNGGDVPGRSLIDTLSDRELEVFQLIGQGLTTGELAQSLHLSPRTIETYRQRLKLKLQLDSAGQLSRAAVQWVLER